MYAIAADRGNRRARALFVSKKANPTLKEIANYARVLMMKNGDEVPRFYERE
jgi:hypothetical protein